MGFHWWALDEQKPVLPSTFHAAAGKTKQKPNQRKACAHLTAGISHAGVP